MLEFLNKKHEERYLSLIKKDNTSETDHERQALFYILAGCTDLFSKGVEKFYDFIAHGITPRKFRNVDLCTSSRAMINLAYNLYNGHGKDTISDTFTYLDGNNMRLAFYAIEIRYFGLK